MEKDFLFFNYSWVWGSTTYFKYFETMGHTIDIIDENTINNFQPIHNYKNIVLYLHEGNTIPLTDKIIDHYKDSFLIQHDDTDEEQLQVWSLKKPNLYMQRELTNDTIINTQSPVIPFHFPMNSIYDKNLNEKKIYDVSFIGNMTNRKRLPFVDHIIKLSQNELSHLNWFIDVKGSNNKPGQPTENFKSVINQSKIGLHYFGNSYDSIRIWEILSCKTALLMPKMKSLSVSSNGIPLNEYVIFKDDFTDLKEKILFLLEDEKWKKIAEMGHNAYNEHNVEKCCNYYYNQVMKYCKK